MTVEPKLIEPDPVVTVELPANVTAAVPIEKAASVVVYVPFSVTAVSTSYVCTPVVVTDSIVRVPRADDVRLVNGAVPPTIPLKLFAAVEVTVKVYAPSTVEAKLIAPDPVVTVELPANVTAAAIEKAAFVVVYVPFNVTAVSTS